MTLAAGPCRQAARPQATCLRVVACSLLASTVWLWSLPALAAEPAAARVRVDALVQPLLDGELIEGLVIGLIQPADAADRLVDDSGTAYFAYGSRGIVAPVKAVTTQTGQTAPQETPAELPDADTLFEIGSVTKPFTCLLLADMVERGEVTLDEPLANLLPKEVKLPSLEGREITLVDLATHSSGLPRMPKNFSPANPADPYADYTAEKMFEFVGAYELRRKPGEQSVYSNLGMGLLGEALSRRAGSDYEALLRERIWQPLRMRDTRVKLDDDTLSRLAAGHDADGVPISKWEFQAIVGAGGIRSSARDMVTFLRANLYLPLDAQTPGTPATGLPDVPETLRRALALSQSPQREIKTPPGEIALAWMIHRDGGTVWHNGQTGGYHSFVAFNRGQGTGVVLLCNSAVGAIDDLGQRLIDLLAGKNPAPPTVKKLVQVDPAVLQTYAGQYNLDNGLGGTAPLTISFEQNRLWAQLPLQPRAGIYPTSDTEFFYKLVDATITFNRDADGQAERLVLRQNGRELVGPKAPAE